MKQIHRNSKITGFLKSADDRIEAWVLHMIKELESLKNQNRKTEGIEK